jgi:hypothetical protein
MPPVLLLQQQRREWLLLLSVALAFAGGDKIQGSA